MRFPDNQFSRATLPGYVGYHIISMSFNWYIQWQFCSCFDNLQTCPSDIFYKQPKFWKWKVLIWNSKQLDMYSVSPGFFAKPYINNQHNVAPVCCNKNIFSSFKFTPQWSVHTRVASSMLIIIIHSTHNICVRCIHCYYDFWLNACE